MVFEVFSLEKAFPAPGGRRAVLRISSLAYAADEYFDCCACIRAHGIGVFHVYFPMIHQCIELYSKCLALHADNQLKTKKYTHKVLSLMSDFRSRIPVFDEIMSDSRKSAALNQLESAYSLLKYGEGGVFCMHDGFEIIDSITLSLKQASVLVWPR